MRLGQGAVVLFALCARTWAGGSDGEISVGLDCGFVVREGGVVRVEGDLQVRGRLRLQGRIELRGDLHAPSSDCSSTAIVQFNGDNLHRLDISESSKPLIRTDGIVVSGTVVVAVTSTTDSFRRAAKEGVASSPLVSLPTDSPFATGCAAFLTRPGSVPSSPAERSWNAGSPLRDGSSRGPPLL